MRLLLFSDVHLETPFSWAPPSVGRGRRRALREVVRRIVVLADELDVDALLCGGDLYEHDLATEATGTFLAETFADLGRPVFVAPGNHDWFGPSSLYARVRWPRGVHVFTEPRLHPVELTPGLTLWGAAHLAPAGTAGFLDSVRVDRGGVNLALFHGTLEGRGAVRGALPHAPFHAEQVERAGLDHAMLGHFHTPDDAPRHTYPGNPEPLTFGESGDRGAVLVEVAPDGTLRRTRHQVAVTSVSDVVLDATGARGDDEVRSRAEALLAPLTGCVRMTLIGELPPESRLDVAGLLDDVGQLGGHLEALVTRAGSLSVGYDLEDLRRLAGEATVRGQFVRDVLASELDADVRRRVLVTGLRALDGRGRELAVP